MSVITVLGEIDKEELGIVAPHEHIFVDTSNRILPEIKETTKRNLFYSKVSIENLGELRLNALAVLDNLVISDEEIAINEILEFKKYGGKTIVDQTNENMGRDPIALRNISVITGLNIIVSTGHYVECLHPSYVKEKNINELAQIMIKEIKQGIDNTGIRAGVIGEIGTSKEIFPQERKVLKASALAQKETNTALFIHTWPWGTNGLEVLKILEESGVNIEKVVICHIDGKLNIDYIKQLLNWGVFIEFENFGKEYAQVYDDEIFIAAHDLDKIDMIYKLKNNKQDYLKQILISTDICVKIELLKYGGYGYVHILKNILPIMKKRGFTQEDINFITLKNAKELLNVD